MISQEGWFKSKVFITKREGFWILEAESTVLLVWRVSGVFRVRGYWRAISLDDTLLFRQEKCNYFLPS